MTMTKATNSVSSAQGLPRKLTLYNYRCVAFAAIASIIVGYCLSAVATTLGQPAFYSYMHLSRDEADTSYSHTVVIQGLSTSLSQVGGFLGSIFVAWTADRYGRIRSFQIASLIIILGGALSAGAVDVPMFLVFRFVSGWGVGMLLVSFPMYAAEISPPRSRGLLVGQFAVGLCVGYNLAAAVSYGCYFAEDGNFAWRFPLALQCALPLVLIGASFWMPESPRWLLLRDRPDEAHTIVMRLHTAPGDHEESFALAEFDLMVDQIHLERSRTGGAVATLVGRWFHLFSKRSYIKRAVLGFVIMFGCQLTGCTVINNYQIILYPGLGVDAAIGLALYWAYVGIAFFANSTSALIIDRLGRRRSFLIGLIGCLTALIGETVATSFLPTTNNAVLVLGVFFIFFFIPFYGSMVDGVMYTYTAEIWPSEIRSEGIALSMTGYWLATIAILQAAPTGFTNCGWRFWLLFICSTAALWLFIFRYFPETGNVPIEEMGRLFGDEVAGSLEAKVKHQSHDDKEANSVEHRGGAETI